MNSVCYLIHCMQRRDIMIIIKKWNVFHRPAATLSLRQQSNPEVYDENTTSPFPTSCAMGCCPWCPTWGERGCSHCFDLFGDSFLSLPLFSALCAARVSTTYSWKAAGSKQWRHIVPSQSPRLCAVSPSRLCVCHLSCEPVFVQHRRQRGAVCDGCNGVWYPSARSHIPSPKRHTVGIDKDTRLAGRLTNLQMSRYGESSMIAASFGSNEYVAGQRCAHSAGALSECFSNGPITPALVIASLRCRLLPNGPRGEAGPASAHIKVSLSQGAKLALWQGINWQLLGTSIH